jgi:hypothetical protein
MEDEKMSKPSEQREAEIDAENRQDEHAVLAAAAVICASQRNDPGYSPEGTVKFVWGLLDEVKRQRKERKS